MVGSNGGTPETRAVVDEADMILFVGCRAGSVTTERWRHPAPGKVRVVHIDIDPAVIGVNYPTEVALVGDARLALAALHDHVARSLEKVPRRAFGRERVARAKAEKFAGFEKLARSDAAPICPERIVATLQELLPRDALVVADAGTPCPYFSAYYEFRSAGRHFITNRAHGALGYALPAAIGAQIGRPAARCVAIMGDGSFGFASGELETIVRLRSADRHGGDRQCDLRLDQGGAEEWVRRALFRGRLHAGPARPDRRGVRDQGVAGGGSGEPEAGARRGARDRRAVPGRRRHPAPARGARPGLGVGRMTRSSVTWRGEAV